MIAVVPGHCQGTVKIAAKQTLNIEPAQIKVRGECSRLARVNNHVGWLVVPITMTCVSGCIGSASTQT